MGSDEQDTTPFLLYAMGVIDLDDYLKYKENRKLW